MADGSDRLNQLEVALREWRDARQAFFDAKTESTPAMITRLGNAEHALMTIARTLD